MTKLDNIFLIDEIDPKFTNKLKKFNIFTVSDLLYLYPNRFEDYSITPLDKLVVDEQATISGYITSTPFISYPRYNFNLMKFSIRNNSNNINCIIYNRAFLRNRIYLNNYVRLTGKLNNKKEFVASIISFDANAKMYNIKYNLDKIPDESILELKEKLFLKYQDDLVDLIPSKVLKKANICSLKDAFRYINIPKTKEEIKLGLDRFKFEEFFMYFLKVKYLFKKRKEDKHKIPLVITQDKIEEFIKNLPFELTVDQINAINDILNDLGSSYKMNRLLQGDVGCGKTIVAGVCLYACCLNNVQSVVMVPTEILARQHYITLKTLFNNYPNIEIGYLSGNLKAKEKREIKEKIKNGQTLIIVGTHALFQKDVEFYNLRFVVTDEEHRFGVKQRVDMINKGIYIDHLKMSATPIPRSLAISIFGESDLTTIKTLPKNRNDVVTKLITPGNTKEIFDHLEVELQNNHQAYIIAPLIEKSKLDLNDVNNIYSRLVKYYQNRYQIGLIHSRLTQIEKDDIMDKFNKNEIQILVSTTVIEVGVNVVNATTIVILDASRFGLAQLHQMRGRIRRSEHKAYCFLVSKDSLERLEILTKSSCGFEIANYDLELRGEGDFLGMSQSGTKIFRYGIIGEELFEVANEISSELINELENYKDLYEVISKSYIENKEKLE